VAGNKVEDSYGDFNLSHQLDSSGLIMVGNIVGTTNGGSLVVVNRGDKTCGD